MSEREQKLLQLKKRILERTNKSSAVLGELQLINKSFSKLSDQLSKSKEIDEIKNNVEFIESFNQVSRELKSVSEKIDKLDFSKLPAPNVIVPEKREVKVINIKEAIPPKTYIDWENKPVDKKVKFDLLSPLKTIYKSLETLISPLIDRITEYITEPDRTTISNQEIVDYYGKRQVRYKIIRDERNKVKEIIRNVV